MTARMVGHELVLAHTNRQSMRCDPRLSDMVDNLGISERTLKRAIAELVDQGWLVRSVKGRGRGSDYRFRFRNRLVVIKGDRNGTHSSSERVSEMASFESGKGVKSGPLSDGKRVPILSKKGARSVIPHNIAKPELNQEARAHTRAGARGGSPRSPGSKLSDNPNVVAEAERAVARFRDGHTDAIAELQPWVRGHVLAAGLLTDAERETAGVGAEKGSAP
ncbi:hypothetical protein [Pelagovum pacificum]|nr:hypothetical protein [Pelagovum pacificum]